MLREIPMVDKVPAGYSRYFYFEEEGHKSVVFVTHEDGLRMGCHGPSSPEIDSHVMDWIQETVEIIRTELQAAEGNGG